MLRCFAALLLVAIWSPSALPQSPISKRDDVAAKLGKGVANYDLGSFNLVGALVKVSNDFEIPMGIFPFPTRKRRNSSPYFPSCIIGPLLFFFHEWTDAFQNMPTAKFVSFLNPIFWLREQAYAADPSSNVSGGISVRMS
jgi:hypothetical protein